MPYPIRRWWHYHVLCRLGLHVEREDDPSIGWSCPYCWATGLNSRRTGPHA